MKAIVNTKLIMEDGIIWDGEAENFPASTEADIAHGLQDRRGDGHADAVRLRASAGGALGHTGLDVEPVRPLIAAPGAAGQLRLEAGDARHAQLEGGFHLHLRLIELA